MNRINISICDCYAKVITKTQPVIPLSASSILFNSVSGKSSLRKNVSSCDAGKSYAKL